MELNSISSNSLSFIGDAIYTLKVREYFIAKGYQNSKILQKKCNQYNSARGQMAVFTALKALDYFNEKELEAYKRGRNHIRHIPKNGDLKTYQCASGFEAILGYLYYSDHKRLDELCKMIFEGGFLQDGNDLG